MSAKCQKRTSPASFDHLIGAGQKRCWYVETERTGGLEVDDHHFHYHTDVSAKPPNLDLSKKPWPPGMCDQGP
jgi:hypothetical protein